MDIEDDDDLYAPEEPTPAPANNDAEAKAENGVAPANASRKDEELESGEEEDEGGEIMEEGDDEDSVSSSSLLQFPSKCTAEVDRREPAL